MPHEEVRKTVTVVFTDVTGWTSLGEGLDPEALRRVMSRYFDEMRGVIERHGGLVEKFIGDAVMAVFGVPVVREDDALRAVRAAEGMRAQLDTLNEELHRDYGVRIQIRTGVNTGEVMVGEDLSEILATGAAVTVAARLEQQADPGEILIGEPTYRLVRDAVEAKAAGPLDLKGKAVPVDAWQLVEVIPDTLGVARMLASPIVGRERELSLLGQALDRAIEAQTCRAVTVLAEAGAGKSRLAAEFIASFGDVATVARGRCLPYGEGITFWPIAEVVRQLGGVSTEDDVGEAITKIDALLIGDPDAAAVRDHVAAVIGLTDVAYPIQETFWAVRKLFESIAKTRPLVVLFDDIHWAEASFLDLLEYLCGWSVGCPIMLLFAARPELLEVRPEWGSAVAPNVETLRLEPLTPAESDLVIGNLVAGADIDRVVRTRISEVCCGNPLFVEEILRMLVDEGLLRRTDGRWVPVGELAAFDIPPTIHALLDARLEGIPSGERAVLQRASVMGKLFSWTAVAELSPEADRPLVGTQLQALVRRAMIHPERAEFAGEDGFAFSHILVRDAAYRGVPKETRATLHRRFAQWLESKSGDVAEEFDEIVGYHLEQSYRYRAELGPLDDGDRRVADDGGRRLGAAGERALARNDVPAAIDLLSRAVALYGEDDPRRLAHMADLGAALAEAGQRERAREVFAEASRRAEGGGHDGLLAHAVLQRWLAMGEGDGTDMRATSERAFDVFEGAGDERGMCRALRGLGEVEYRAGRIAARDQLVERALVHARNAGDAKEQAEIFQLLSVDLTLGPTPALAAIRRCEELVAEEGGNRAISGSMFHALAHLHAMRGEFDVAMSYADRFREILRENGAMSSFWFYSEVPANVKMLAGEPDEAVRILMAGYEHLQQMGETNPVLASLLGQGLYATGRYREARTMAEFASEGDVAHRGQFARGSLAKVLARDGEFTEAEQMARGVVAFFGANELLDSQGLALLDLAEVLYLASRPAEAIATVGEAVEVFIRKGNIVLAEASRKVAAQYAGSTPDS